MILKCHWLNRWNPIDLHWRSHIEYHRNLEVYYLDLGQPAINPSNNLTTTQNPVATAKEHPIVPKQWICKGKHKLQVFFFSFFNFPSVLTEMSTSCPAVIALWENLSWTQLTWLGLLSVILKTLSITEYPLAKPYVCNPTSIRRKVTQPG